MGPFTLAALLLMVTPGPGVLSVAGVGSGFGFRAGLPYLWGLWLGNFLVGIAVVTGLAAIVFSVNYLREFLLFASAGYLIYLATKIAMSGRKIAFILSEKPPGFFAGVSLQMINPKAYVVNTTLFTGFAFLPDSLLQETLIKFVILNALWIPIHFAWLTTGTALKKLSLDERVQRAINVTMAFLMIVVVAMAAMT